VTANETELLAGVLDRYEGDRRELISLLQDVQAGLGYLPREAMSEVARFLDMPAVEVWGAASFYNQFRFAPLGKYPVKVCMGTACHLAGGKLVLEALEREFNVPVGGTTEDGNFSLERVACVGCCMLAPVMLIGEKVYPRMTAFKVEEALVPYNQAIRQEASGAGDPPDGDAGGAGVGG